MAEERGYGVIEYKGKEYHYIQEGQFLTIPSISFQEIKEFEENEVIDVIHGSTSNYQGIVFLDCKVLMGTHLFLSEVKIRILGYIILDYYLYLRDFLVFVNGQRCIPLDRIELFEKNESGGYEKQGRAVIFQEDSSCYVPNPYNSITFDDITSDCFPVIFGQIAEKRNRNYYYHLFYPANHKDHQRIDASKWLNTAICFESEFNCSFPNFKAKQDATFHSAKTLLLQAIDEEVRKSGKSINNKQNSALKSFRSLVDHSDTTIKQKFQVCEENYKDEMGEAIQRICSLCRGPADTDLSEVYSSYRNKTAHGAISRPEDCDVATYRIMRGFIYVMNLKRANIPQEKIKSIVNKLYK